MEVILTQDVKKVGKAGSVVKVKDGFARNYLFPKKIAVPLSNINIQKIEQEKQKKNSLIEAAKKEAQELKEKLADISLTISVLTQESDKLYGSVASGEIQEALKQEGFDIDKSCILMDGPIKSVGIYEIPIKLHAEVSAKIKVWIVKK